MTTETTSPSGTSRPYGVAALRAAVLGAVGCVVVLAAVAALVRGGSGVLGVLAGAGLALVVLATGLVVVDLVAGALPGASMLVALLTYTLEVVALGAVLLALGRADGAADALAPRWFGGGLVTVALAWTVCLVAHARQARVPLYDLPATPAPRAGRGAAQGSER